MPQNWQKKKGAGKKFDTFYEIKPDFLIELSVRVSGFLKGCMGKVVPRTWAQRVHRQS